MHKVLYLYIIYRINYGHKIHIYIAENRIENAVYRMPGIQNSCNKYKLYLNRPNNSGILYAGIQSQYNTGLVQLTKKHSVNAP